MQFFNGFDVNRALTLAQLSNEAYIQYENYTKGIKWAGPKGYKFEISCHAAYEGNNIPIGFIASKEDDVYISWRGTSTAKEWIEDGKFEQIVCPYLPDNVKVHLGFNQLYTTTALTQSPREVVIDYLSKRQIKGSIYVTGHSLGAALATLNALDIHTNTSCKNVKLYSFASPRVGEPRFASFYNRRVTDSWRVVNANDEVPCLPLKSALEEHYMHVNSEVDIKFGRNYIWDWAGAHSLENYINQLKVLKYC
ncbi:lipase family protein [Shewanella waksmanii]|uniref:lipase family protein n=1 Tax=Shewanella waksmanii TaxID=213783 RepID=UPI00373545D6